MKTIQETKVWLARWVNQRQNTTTLMTASDIDDIDAQKLMDFSKEDNESLLGALRAVQKWAEERSFLLPVASLADQINDLLERAEGPAEHTSG